MDKPKYKRVLLKLSGEALAGDRGIGINNEVVNEIAVAIKKIREIGVEVASGTLKISLNLLQTFLVLNIKS